MLSRCPAFKNVRNGSFLFSSVSQIKFPTIDQIKEAKTHISSHISPHNFCRLDFLKSEKQNVFLKMENLQVNNSYKIRGALNCISHLLQENNEFLNTGIATASSGNFALQLAYVLKLFNLKTTLILAVPSFSSLSKLNKIKAIYENVKIIKLLPEDWIQIILSNNFNISTLKFAQEQYNFKTNPLYISTTTNTHVMAGVGTIGLELIENLKETYPENIEKEEETCAIIPYGGGGLTISVALALKQSMKNIKIFTCEIETGAPLKASLEKGKPTFVDFKPSFCDGIGSVTVIPGMFEKVRDLIEDSLTVTVNEAEEGLKYIFEKKHMVVEGAAACSLASYFKYKNTVLKKFKNVICILTGGNIDYHSFEEIIKKQN